MISSARTTTEGRTMAKADLKHYQDAVGHVFSMTEADARLLGYAPVKTPAAEPKAAAPPTPPEGRGR